MSKKLFMIISSLSGGGAERVAAMLTNEFNKNGYSTEVIVTNTPGNKIIDPGFDENIKITAANDIIAAKGLYDRLLCLISSVLCKPFEILFGHAPAVFAAFSVKSQYRQLIKYLRSRFREEPGAAALAFLQPAIPVTVLSARGLDIRVVFSERGDANRIMKKRYGYHFIKKYFGNVSAAVFQTPDAQNAYPPEIARKGVVISNPLRDNLPEPFIGDRNKTVTTFCRISRQKNLPLLIKAFELFREDFPDWRLKITGGAESDEGKKVMKELETLINTLSLGDAVSFFPFSDTVLNGIVKDGMYVNSSDFEGMSNAMLEAMAVGLPCVCTDCPAGGAKAIIRDGENGLLVPVGDEKALADAMKKIASNPEFANGLSENGIKLREELSLTATAKKWMELL